MKEKLKLERFEVYRGSPTPFGATAHDSSVNFAIFSTNAVSTTLCLISLSDLHDETPPVLELFIGKVFSINKPEMPHAMALPTCSTVCSVAQANMKAKGKQSPSSVGFGSRRKEPLWRCVEGCGACCKLDKGPSFPTPEEIFTDPRDIELYRSLMGPDGWCINFDKGNRTCSIYNGEHPLGHILQQFLLLTLSLYGFFFLWQIVHIFVVWSQRYSNHCLELRRRNSTKRHAVFVEISSKKFMAPNQRSWITSTIQ
ncbi:hypothetical protein SO802_030342 [Lithocarpus litseifolius]|uniref:Uncharacterized protein n=1 Tax=Lithocarpus litseifolius TaxID=425828 RepID=A0AAW2BJD8_9ROSI